MLVMYHQIQLETWLVEVRQRRWQPELIPISYAPHTAPIPLSIINSTRGLAHGHRQLGQDSGREELTRTLARPNFFFAADTPPLLFIQSLSAIVNISDKLHINCPYNNVQSRVILTRSLYRLLTQRGKRTRSALPSLLTDQRVHTSLSFREFRSHSSAELNK